MMLTKYLFYFFSVLAVYASVMVLMSKKPIHSVLYLTLAFLAIAGHLVLLNAQFIAIVNVIVYAGAIMVLFLFTVMLLNLNLSPDHKKSFIVRLTAVIAAGLLFITLTGAIKKTDLVYNQVQVVTQIGMVKNLGKVLFSDFRLPFEVSGILFLSAMVGAVMLGKKTGD
jgi:NADH-quinone oxidoreductase subunit J